MGTLSQTMITHCRSWHLMAEEAIAVERDQDSDSDPVLYLAPKLRADMLAAVCALSPTQSETGYHLWVWLDATVRSMSASDWVAVASGLIDHWQEHVGPSKPSEPNT